MRGARIFLFCLSFLFMSLQLYFAEPPGENIDYSKYFTNPERTGTIIYVFYNNFIDKADDKQFSYALLLGFEYAAKSAKPKDWLAVGIYFSNDKGKIYFIYKSVFDTLSKKELNL